MTDENIGIDESTPVVVEELAQESESLSRQDIDALKAARDVVMKRGFDRGLSIEEVTDEAEKEFVRLERERIDLRFMVSIDTLNDCIERVSGHDGKMHNVATVEGKQGLDDYTVAITDLRAAALQVVRHRGEWQRFHETHPFRPGEDE